MKKGLQNNDHTSLKNKGKGVLYIFIYFNSHCYPGKVKIICQK